jgi:hypothetical protein
VNLKRTEVAMAFFKVRMCITNEWAKQLQIAGASTNIITVYKRK